MEALPGAWERVPTSIWAFQRHERASREIFYIWSAVREIPTLLSAARDIPTLFRAAVEGPGAFWRGKRGFRGEFQKSNHGIGKSTRGNLRNRNDLPGNRTMSCRTRGSKLMSRKKVNRMLGGPSGRVGARDHPREPPSSSMRARQGVSGCWECGWKHSRSFERGKRGTKCVLEREERLRE